MFDFETTDRVDRRRPASSLPDAVSVWDLVLRVWAARYWGIGGAVIMCVLAVVYASLATPRFEAGAQVYIDPKDLQLFQNGLTANPGSSDSGTVIIESQARIMQSMSVLRDVVETLGLDTDTEFVGEPSPFSVAGLKAMLKGPGSGDTDPVSLAAEVLGKQVHVVRADQTYVVEIYAEADDAQTAANIANAVVNSYLSLRQGRRSEQADGASTALEARLEALFDDLETAENTVERFRVENGLVDANGNLLVEDRLSQANRDLSAAEAALLAARAQADQLRGARGNPDRFLSSEAALASPDLLRLRGEIERVEAELNTLAATLGERHPRRVQAAGRLSSLRRSLAAEVGRLDRAASLAVERAERQRAEARAALGRLTGESQTSDSALLTLRQLEREAEAKRAIYESALLRARETREQQNINTVNAQLVSPATAPLRKSSPPGLSTLLPAAAILGGLLGGSLGLVVGWLRPATARRNAPADVWDDEEIEDERSDPGPVRRPATRMPASRLAEAPRAARAPRQPATARHTRHLPERDEAVSDERPKRSIKPRRPSRSPAPSSSRLDALLAEDFGPTFGHDIDPAPEPRASRRPVRRTPERPAYREAPAHDERDMRPAPRRRQTSPIASKRPPERAVEREPAMTPQERLRQRALNLLGDDHAVSPSRPVADTRDAIARATERFGSPERVFGDEPRRPRRRRDAV